MGKHNTAVLTLIYNHLLQHGLCKTAKKLQAESGVKFDSHEKTLIDMYKLWNRRDQQSKKKARSKKTSEQNPTSSESSENKGTEAGIKAEDKEVSAKKTGKTMNPARKSTAKGKAAPRSKKLASLTQPLESETPAAEASAPGSDGRDHKEEIAPSDTAPTIEPPSRSTKSARVRSKPTNTKAAKQPKRVSSKTTKAAATKLLTAANGPARDNDEVGDGSKSNDETDIEKQIAPALAGFEIKAPTPSAKTAAAEAKAKKGSTKTPAKRTTTARKAPAKASSEDLHSDSKAPVPAVSAVIAAASSAKTAAAQARAKRGSAKTTAVTPAAKGSTATGKTPAKKVSSESSEESDLDSDFVPSSIELSAPSNVVTPNRIASVRPGALQSMADDSSESSETESEEEPVKQIQKKTPSPKKSAISTSPAKAPRAPAPKLAAATQDSESRDDSDSEPEMKAPQKTAPVAASQDTLEPPGSEALVVRLAKPGASDCHDASADLVVTASIGETQSGAEAEVSEPSDCSDSAEEPEIQKKTPSPKKSAIATSPAKAARAPAPKLAAATQDSESSDDSDSEPEMKAPQVPTPAAVATKQMSRAKPIAVTPASQSIAAAGRTPAKMAADESSEESDSDDGQKVSASQKKTSPKPPSSAGRTAVAGKMIAQPKPSQDSSETSESEEEEPQIAATAPQQRTPALGAKGKPVVFTAAQPDEESSSEESEDDSDEPVKAKSRAPTPAVTARTVKSVMKPTALTPSSQGSAAAARTPAKMAADETSEDSDSDDEEPISAVKPSVLTTPSAKPSAPPSAHVPDSDADSESSDSSDSEEITKNQGSQTKISATLPAPVGKSKVAGKNIAQSKPTQDETESSEEEKPQVAVLKLQLRNPALARGKQGVAAQADESSSEESEDSDEPAKSVPAPAIAARKPKSIAKPTALTLVSQSSFCAVSSPAKMAAEESSEESDSEDEVEARALTPAKATVKKGKSPLPQTPSPSKLGTVKSATKTPVAINQATAKVSNEPSEKDPSKEKKTSRTTVAKQKSSTASPLLTVMSDVASPAKGKAGVKMAPVLAKNTSESESDVNESKQGKVLSPSSSQKSARKVSGDVSRTAGDSADDGSEPDASQSLLQSKPKKRKLSLGKKDKTTPVNESTEKTSGKKAKVQTQPETKPSPPAPSTPSALLDSEEETVLALLEGRSPKKAKLKKSSSTKRGVVADTVVTENDSNVLEKSLLQPVATFLTEDDDFNVKSPGTLDQLSSKKSRKKRKIASEDSMTEEKDKKAKKVREKEKVMADSEAEMATSPKPSKKEKSDLDKKENHKTKKESKKLMQSQMASFGESTDSGVGLQPKPKKKVKD
ncbi:treacle protein isoform X2 [Anomaloglossus baeobatrachus]|uniref:treacle protein isoform X2 n=1 Tax=Anomaloglossus baeobatrachus TaxID=238106 RepID=UPI003F4F86DF